jgi:hypothetical protein
MKVTTRVTRSPRFPQLNLLSQPGRREGSKAGATGLAPWLLISLAVMTWVGAGLAVAFLAGWWHP